jgi:hypothetical protein
MELFTAQALLRAPNAAPMFRELVDLWSRLDVVSRRRAAGCSYLLVDAGFADPWRWRWVGRNRVSDREPVSYTAFFTAFGAAKVAHQAFVYAWHIARTRRLGAPMHLGMPEHCASLLGDCTLCQVTELADQHAGWLRPRWPGRVRLWRELLLAAISGEEPALEMARQHGMQLLAVELKAFEQVDARQPR